MGWNDIKIDKADSLFSRYIRLKARKCANCGKLGNGKEGIVGLQASHFYSRRKESVRYDEQNVDVFCIGCHRKLGTENRKAYEEFKLKQLGEKGYNLLLVRANTYTKKDRKLFEIYYKEQLKRL